MTVLAWIVTGLLLVVAGCVGAVLYDWYIVFRESNRWREGGQRSTDVRRDDSMTKQTVTESQIVAAALAWLDAWEHASRTNYTYAHDEAGARAAALRGMLRKYRKQQKDAAGREDAR